MRTCTKTACCLHQAAPSVGWDKGTAKMPLARPAEVDGTGPLTLPPARCTVQVTSCRHRIPRAHSGGNEKAKPTCSSSTSCCMLGFRWRISATLYATSGLESLVRRGELRAYVWVCNLCTRTVLDEAVLIYFERHAWSAVRGGQSDSKRKTVAPCTERRRDERDHRRRARLRSVRREIELLKS